MSGPTDNRTGQQLADLRAKAEFLTHEIQAVSAERDRLRAALAEETRLGEVAAARIAVISDERDSFHQRLLDANELLVQRPRWRGFPAVGKRDRRRLTVVAVEESAALGHDWIHGAQHDPASDGTAAEFVEQASRRSASFRLRLEQAVHLLSGSVITGQSDGDALDAFAEALAGAAEPSARLAWLALVVGDGRYPTEAALMRATRLFDRLGAPALAREAFQRSAIVPNPNEVAPGGLDIRVGMPLVDITHTATHDLHTGIQRVVRELCSRWFRDKDLVPVAWHAAGGGLRVLAPSEQERMKNWRDFLHEPGGHVTQREPVKDSDRVLVPWRCRIVVPELSIESYRCEGYRSLAASGVLAGLSFLAYDMIPLSCPETMPLGMAQAFADYLSNVRSADRVSAISRTSANEFQAFLASTAASRGTRSPIVACHSLPTAGYARIRDVGEGQAGAGMASLEEELAIADASLVLVVGSHEPRKNHLAVLDAAERLWAAGRWFHLLFIGGASWRDGDFWTEVDRLKDAGHPVHVMTRVSEGRLWAAYNRALFTIFPSLVEGFGLPIAESLQCATPVLASNYGSMREVADGGGAILLDPRSTEEIMMAMDRLLGSPAEVRSLSDEAARRTPTDWEAYADEVWRFLVPNA